MSPRSRELLIVACLVVAAVIHLLPLAGVAGGSGLQRLYGLTQTPEAAAELLLRHRAILFAVLSAGLLAACWLHSWRVPAITMMLASDLAFLWFAWTATSLTPELQSVAWTDVVSVVALLLALLVRR